MKLLALDTATEACSAALYVDGCVASRESVIGRGHAELVLGMIDDLLGAAGLRLAELDAIAVGRGPGAFTGVRIAIAVAQGLAAGAELPVVPVSDLAAVGVRAIARAESEWGAGPWEALVALDARMGEVYAARVRGAADGRIDLSDEAIVRPAEAFRDGPAGADQLGAGHGWSAYPELLAGDRDRLRVVWPELLPNASDIARIAVQQYAAGVRVTPEALTPVYLRDQVASQRTDNRAK